MTEAEWLSSVNSQAMIARVRDKGSERIWRLVAVACVRTVEAQMRDARSSAALDTAERFADGTATREELRAARAQAEAAAQQAHLDEWEDEVRVNFGWDAAYEALCAARWAADAALPCVADDVDSTSVHESLRLPDLIREIFGNPFQWNVIHPGWLSWSDGAVLHLAQTIYNTRSFDLLPILADALEDAGCDNADILSHLRGPGPHVRGCWALDLLLDKQ
jgi:hypothetical protein